MTKTATAKELGISVETLRKYCNSEGFPEVGDLEEMQEWVLAHKNKKNGDGDNEEPSLFNRKTMADVRWKEARAKTAEMERNRLEGVMVYRKDVERQWKTAGAIFRDKLLRLPGSIRNQISSFLSDPDKAGEVEAIFDNEIRQAMDKIIEEMNRE